jgi:hypothetical protein
MRAIKTISNREFKRGTHEERLAEGESLRVVKEGGKSFLVKREPSPVSLSKVHAEIMAQIPLGGPTQKTDFAAMHEEDEE